MQTLKFISDTTVKSVEVKSLSLYSPQNSIKLGELVSHSQTFELPFIINTFLTVSSAPAVSHVDSTTQKNTPFKFLAVRDSLASHSTITGY